MALPAPENVASLLDRRLLIVSGKGGTGKTTVTAALARLGVRQGKRVLTCEVDAKGSLAASLGASGPVGYEPAELQPGLFAMEMDTEASLREYLRVFLRVPFMSFPVAGLGPLARTFDFVADAAPGVKEILTIGKLAWAVKERNYDLVVVDAPASGHVGSLLDAPGSLARLMPLGPVRTQTGWVRALLADPATTGLVVVTIPQEMATVEAIELVASVRAQAAVDIAAVVVNRVLPELFTHAEDETRTRLSSPTARAGLRRSVGPGVQDVLAAGDLAAELRRSGVAHLAVLRQAVAGTALLYLPEVWQAELLEDPVLLTEALATNLSEEL